MEFKKAFLGKKSGMTCTATGSAVGPQQEAGDLPESETPNDTLAADLMHIYGSAPADG